MKKIQEQKEITSIAQKVTPFAWHHHTDPPTLFEGIKMLSKYFHFRTQTVSKSGGRGVPKGSLKMT